MLEAGIVGEVRSELAIPVQRFWREQGRYFFNSPCTLYESAIDGHGRPKQVSDSRDTLSYGFERSWPDKLARRARWQRSRTKACNLSPEASFPSFTIYRLNVAAPGRICLIYDIISFRLSASMPNDVAERTFAKVSKAVNFWSKEGPYDGTSVPSY
jgi:hypothetical protein